MAGTGETSATDDSRISASRIDQIGSATANDLPGAQPAEASPTVDSSPAVTSNLLSNQSFDLWIADATQVAPGGQFGDSEVGTNTLHAKDGSPILSFNSDWFNDSEPHLASAKNLPTDRNSPTPKRPGAPMDLLPRFPLEIPVPKRDPRKGQTEAPGAKRTPPGENIPLPPRKPLRTDTDVPRVPKTDETETRPRKAKEGMEAEAKFLPSRNATKPGQTTVIVLDDYRQSDMIVNQGKGFSHGELSARMAEENGFNTVRLQIGLRADGHYDLVNSLGKLCQSIDDGSLKVKKGDIVNLSFDLAKTFESASKMLGIQVTRENLHEKRGEILDIMRAKSVDHSTPKRDREFMRTVLAIDEGVKNLQERGLTVVAAAGNAGKNSFNIGFLSADKHFSALDPDGRKASYSADNSMTTPGLGEVNIYSLPVNMFDSTPFSEQKGTYRVGGTNIYLPAEEFAGNFNPVTKDPEVLRMMLFHNTTIGGGLSGFTRDTGAPPRISRFEGSAFTPIDAGATGLPIKPAYLAEFNPASWTLGTNVLSVKGTSFVNIFKLKELQCVDFNKAIKKSC